MQQQEGERQGTWPRTEPLEQPDAAAPQPQQQDGGDAPVGPEDPFHALPAELVQGIAGCLAPNEVACVLRLVSKATAALLSRPQDRTVRLSLPVPHHAFVRRWGREDATRSLNRDRREQLACLTARSGSVANLEVLLAGGDVAAVLSHRVLNTAASAGLLEVCRWFRQQVRINDVRTLSEAARGGHQTLCEWLLANGSGGTQPMAAGAAARGGHVGLMEWFLQAAAAQAPGWPDATLEDVLHIPGLLAGAAEGCDLPTLQRLHHTYLDSAGREMLMDHDSKGRVVNAAAASPTADWRAKVEWLLGRGYPRSVCACHRAAELPDARDRLEWLLARRFPLRPVLVAADRHNLDVVEYVLAAGAAVDRSNVLAAGAAMGKLATQSMAADAARAGRLAILQALLDAPGFGAPALAGRVAAAAAGSGHMHVTAWLAETLGIEALMMADVFAAAARSGGMEMLAWLHAQGRPPCWSPAVLCAAVESGSEEQVEWLAAHGYAQEEDGGLYSRALARVSLPMLRCLRRLGFPWGPGGRTFTDAVKWNVRTSYGSPAELRLLQWLLEQGCPVDWDAAVVAAKKPELVAWLGQQQQQQQQQQHHQQQQEPHG
ncbi:hypothetical protein TSOC_013279 [Tetrabaena socialis]|uniref:Ankyrin repeat domain-containing protein n=1 Tax=Tetrabaena socialis TaxID=47790 RepID=A0A2J7ZKR9_9CHLO|nr:hypothetical protein TSOC_013279 [Tetrabaena socialis]|eukprot:PNH00865.1 hypothetical protein TSOC_013279 [Tetrabaena socialis]